MLAPCDGCLKQRTGNSLLYSLQSLVIALCLADTDMGDTFICHNSLNICEVKVDQCRQIDQVCDALILPAAEPRLLSLSASGIVVRRSTISSSLSFGITIRVSTLSFNFSIPVKSVAHTCFCLKTERFCHNTDSQDAHFFCNALQQPVQHLFRFRRPYRR